MKNDTNIAVSPEPGVQTEDFALRVRVNQAKLTAKLKQHYDFVVCGAGSSGSVAARRLAENPDVSVLLLEAGGDDGVPEVAMENANPFERIRPRLFGRTTSVRFTRRRATPPRFAPSPSAR